MTIEEFRKRVEDDPEWAPGWEIIDKEFDRLYPGVKPGHYATDMASRAVSVSYTHLTLPTILLV